jgi:transposase
MTPSTVAAIRSPFNHVVAFEVSKETLVVHALPADRQCSIPNSPLAIRRVLKAEIKRNMRESLGPLLVVCEATGGYERHVLAIAIDLGLSVHRAHGSRVRCFARYRGLVAKTDPIDARMLAEFGQQTQDLRLYAPPPPECEALKALQGRRSEIQAMLMAENNRLEHAHNATVRKSLKLHIKALKAAMAAIEAEIAELVRSSADLRTKTNLMRSVTGVGPVTAATLLAYLPDLGQLTRGQVARRTGLAPINNDSGKKKGARHIEPGRQAIKRCLYMAASVAMKANPALKIFADRLRRNGYPFKYVVTAVMRKLVVILNAVLRDGEPWKGLRTA